MPATARDFTDWLEEVTLVTWYRAALACPAAVPPDLEIALDRALGAPEMAFDAWSTRDDVAAALWRFVSPEGRRLVRPARLRGHIRLVTERAALALVVRRKLGDGSFAQAFGAFADHFAIEAETAKELAAPRAAAPCRRRA